MCIFCGERDESFTEEGLDLHYWKHCPMLKRCEHCKQVNDELVFFFFKEVHCKIPALACAICRSIYGYLSKKSRHCLIRSSRSRDTANICLLSARTKTRSENVHVAAKLCSRLTCRSTSATRDVRVGVVN